MACKWKGKAQKHFCVAQFPPLGETIYFEGISLILRQNLFFICELNN